MSEILERLMRIKESSSSKSYFIGLERGRLWAEDRADYYDMRQWSELNASEFDDLVLPDEETNHYKIITAETSIQWEEYLKGWLDGVREIVRRY